ncbi:acyltransferase family protein [Marinobacter sp.]|uniref:acyltransferase family protein n=1 Tax=Marinobacter sp. TaxID=50741 RepID=UPI003A902E0E
MDNQKTNLAQLTWLRGIASFWVICSHVNRAGEVSYTEGDTASSSIILSVLDLGTLGVALFFTLSGVTLFISNREISTQAPMRFYIKRFFRIWPAYFVALLLYIAAGFVFREWYIGDPEYWVAEQFMREYSWYDIALYSTLSFNVFGPEGLFNNAFWSLPVEFQYYLMFPFLIVLLGFFGLSGPLVFGFLVYLAYRSGILDIHSNLVFIFAFTFCSGVCIGALFKKTEFRVSPTFFSICSFLILALNVLVTNEIIPVSFFVYIPSEWVFFGLSAVVLVALATFTEIRVSARLDRIMIRYGDISYSTYLYHNVVIAFLVLGLPFFEFSNSAVRLLYLFIPTILITYWLAALSFRYIEQPFMRIGRSLSAKKPTIRAVKETAG